MSGGALTDYGGGLYHLKEWSEKIRPVNPLLAEQLRDLYTLLDRYDYFLSGDIGEARLTEAWEAYSAKWLGITPEQMTETVVATARAEIEGYLQSLKLGYNPNREEGCR